MNKDTFVNSMRDEHAQWIKAVEVLKPERLSKPGLNGCWSIKDIIAHISWYEREMSNVIQQRKLVGSPLWNLSTDERNAAIFKIIHDLPLKKVLDEAKTVFDELMAAVETLSDEELINSSHFAEMPADWVPWQVIAGNSFEHYRQHLPDATNLQDK